MSFHPQQNKNSAMAIQTSWAARPPAQPLRSWKRAWHGSSLHHIEGIASEGLRVGKKGMLGVGSTRSQVASPSDLPGSPIDLENRRAYQMKVTESHFGGHSSILLIWSRITLGPAGRSKDLLVSILPIHLLPLLFAGPLCRPRALPAGGGSARPPGCLLGARRSLQAAGQARAESKPGPSNRLFWDPDEWLLGACCLGRVTGPIVIIGPLNTTNHQQQTVPCKIHCVLHESRYNCSWVGRSVCLFQNDCMVGSWQVPLSKRGILAHSGQTRLSHVEPLRFCELQHVEPRIPLDCLEWEVGKDADSCHDQSVRYPPCLSQCSGSFLA